MPFDTTNEAQPQPPAPVPPDPLEIALTQEWQAEQLAQQHVADVLSKIIEAWRRDRARIIGLEAELAAARKVAELIEPR